LFCTEHIHKKHDYTPKLYVLALSADSKLLPATIRLKSGVKKFLHDVVGLSLMSHEAQHDGTIIDVNGQRSCIFQSQCTIQDKVWKLIIDGAIVLLILLAQIWYILYPYICRRLPTLCYMQ
jgi:hypothetical protein